MKHRRDQNSWQRQTCLIHAHICLSVRSQRSDKSAFLFLLQVRISALISQLKWASTALLAKNHSCPHTFSDHWLVKAPESTNGRFSIFYVHLFFVKYLPPSPCSSEVWESDLTSGPCPLPPNTGDGGPRTCPRILHFYHSALCLFPLRGTVSP